MLYFVSTRSYATTLSTIYRGRFEDGAVADVELVAGVSPMRAGMVNFDAEISADGYVLYFVDGQFAGGGVPETADLVIADRDGTGFVRRPDGATLLAAVNTPALEYAPCISASGRELFFTRVEAGADPAIYVATRAQATEPFGPPRRVVAATGFVEAPALSADGHSLYYHKLEDGRFVLYRVTR